MITRQVFAEIDEEVKSSINEILDGLKHINQSDYVLFLAEGEYIKDHENNTLNLNLRVFIEVYEFILCFSNHTAFY